MYAFRWIFFFQAEDGIRDRDVTGVQTCALPICQTSPDPLFGADISARRDGAAFAAKHGDRGHGRRCRYGRRVRRAAIPLHRRSEERRVGKEWRTWGWWWGLEE